MTVDQISGEPMGYVMGLEGSPEVVPMNPILKQRIGLATVDQILRSIIVKPLLDEDGNEYALTSELWLTLNINGKAKQYRVAPEAFMYIDAQNAISALERSSQIQLGTVSQADLRQLGMDQINKFFATWLKAAAGSV